jgi:hypothetical protein
MAQLRIFARGATPQAQANTRGHLFEKLMAEVLRTYEYSISSRPSVNYAGMEIDIEGREILSQIPLYAECKCYESEVDSPKLQAFVGKYVTRWRKDKRCRGMFIALPALNSHARGYFKENFEVSTDMTISLLEEDDVMAALVRAGLAVSGSVVASKIPDGSTAGDQVLMYTEQGPIWIQYLVSHASAIADAYAVYDGKGNAVSDTSTIEYIQEVYPDLKGFKTLPTTSAPQPAIKEVLQQRGHDSEQVVEVRGSSAWFEYQFPASPQYFVGRNDLLNDVKALAESILNRETSVRGLLFEGNSGWGKSSAVLSAAELLKKQGHFAIVVDSRSVSAPRSVLRIVDLVLNNLAKESGELFATNSTPITGFDGAVGALLSASAQLSATRRLGFIFLDQFENVFFIPDALKRIRDLLLKMCDAQANIVIGFAWKTDLIGATNDFPYRVRDSIAESSKRLSLSKFSDVETNALLDKLGTELRTKLRKDLRFFLSEFSQGFPWLLKKLCAHVKTQRENGVQQSEIANRLLNVEELFKEDLSGLTPQQEDALRRIGKAAPVTVSELSEHYSAELVQSLVDARLVVRIGAKYDIYWDIFRDYLNEGSVPVQENYLPRALVSAVVKTMMVLVRAGASLDFQDFQVKSGLSEHSAMNVIRDLRLLGLVNVEPGRIGCTIAVHKSASESEILQSIRAHVQERLSQNRLISRLILSLKAEGSLNLNEVATRLSQWCPYVTAAPNTWRTYARLVAAWMDLADLATYKANMLSYYEPATELRQRDLKFKRVGRKGILIPRIQFSPVEKVALEIGAMLGNQRRVNWDQFTESTRLKSFAVLEDLGFISRTSQGYRINPELHSLVLLSSEARRANFAVAAAKLPAFSQFLSLLSEYSESGCSQLELGRMLRLRLGAGWTDGTGKTNVKIMADWARHLGLAPGVFAENRRMQKRADGLGKAGPNS